VDWKNVTGSFNIQFEVQCGLEQMIEDDVLNNFELLCGLGQMGNNALMT
jgi:hypothetical protein